MTKRHLRPITIEQATHIVNQMMAENDNNQSAVAAQLGLANSAPISLLLGSKQYLMPAFCERLVKLELITIEPERYRVCADFATAERLASFKALMKGRGTTLTRWMNQELDKETENEKTDN